MAKTKEEWKSWFQKHHNDTVNQVNESDADVWVAYDTGQHHEFGNVYVYYMCERNQINGVRDILNNSLQDEDGIIPIGIYICKETHKPQKLIYFKNGHMIEVPDDFHMMDKDSQQFTWELL